MKDRRPGVDFVRMKVVHGGKAKSRSFAVFAEADLDAHLFHDLFKIPRVDGNGPDAGELRSHRGEAGRSPTEIAEERDTEFGFGCQYNNTRSLMGICPIEAEIRRFPPI